MTVRGYHNSSEARGGRDQSENQSSYTRNKYGHTVNAASAAEALPGWYNSRAAAKCRARLGDMQAHGARAGREVAQVVQGLGVGRVVVRCGARFEQEDAQVRVCGSESTGDDARSCAPCYNWMHMQSAGGKIGKLRAAHRQQ